jgi:hypothetical protein
MKKEEVQDEARSGSSSLRRAAHSTTCGDVGVADWLSMPHKEPLPCRLKARRGIDPSSCMEDLFEGKSVYLQHNHHHHSSHYSESHIDVVSVVVVVVAV